MNEPNELPLVIGYGEYEYEQIKALIDKTVTIEDCTTSFISLSPGEMLFRSFEDPQFNVAELSLSNYVIRRTQGDCPYVAIPAYVFRSFRHSNLYVRNDRGISTPQDLRGRRVGIAQYQNTSHVWDRGILEDEYGVRASEVHWVSFSTDAHRYSKEGDFKAPPGIFIEQFRGSKTSSEMLENGEIDALLSARAPPCFTRRAPHVARLFSDHERVEDDYFRRNGIFPILHLMGIKGELLDRHPWLAQKLFRAFVAAKDIALSARTEVAASTSVEPALTADSVRMTKLMGKDYYSYGLNEGNCKTLNLFLHYHFKQGLSDRRFEVAELFSPLPMSHYQT